MDEKRSLFYFHHLSPHLLNQDSAYSGNKMAQAEKSTGSLIPRVRGMSLIPDKPIGLYNPSYDKDACGVGFIAELSGDYKRNIVSTTQNTASPIHYSVTLLLIDDGFFFIGGRWN